MRLQRLLIPLLFALLLVVAYVVAAQTDENLPDPYQAPSLNVIEPGALALSSGAADGPVVLFLTTERCETP